MRIGLPTLLWTLPTLQVAFVAFYLWTGAIVLAAVAGAIAAFSRSGRFGSRPRIEPRSNGTAPLASSVAEINASWLTGCRQVAATGERFREFAASHAPAVDLPTIAELEKALAQPIRTYELHHRNWRNRVYRLELEDGAVLFLKQVALGTEATVRGQFEELEALSRLQVPGLRVPRPVALLLEKRILIMEFVPGETITALLSRPAFAEEGLRGCELAGAVLAGIHRAWGEGLYPLPVKDLAEDMATIPWRLSHGQEELLRRLLGELDGARVSVGRMHYDYEPDNLMLHHDELFLIDPSAGIHRGVQLFEVATFRNALRRRLTIRWMRRPASWRAGMLSQGIDRFEKGYLDHGGAADLERKQFTLAARFFELQRLGQIFVSQRAKIDMAQQKRGFGWEVGGALMNRARFGPLDVYTAWLFRQLARELQS